MKNAAKSIYKFALSLSLLLLLSACSGKDVQSDVSLEFRHENGSSLYLGMDMKSFEDVYGFQLDDGWEYHMADQSLSVMAQGGSVALLRLNEGWTVGEFFSVGDSLNTATLALGEPHAAKTPMPMQASTLYSSTYEAEGHSLNIISDENDNILSVTVCDSDADTSSFSATGLVTYHKEGSGNFSFEYAGIGGYLDISCNSGAFNLTSTDERGEMTELVSSDDGYNGRVLMPYNTPCSFEISASDQWRIMAKYPLKPMPSAGLSGSSDFVTDLLADGSGKWGVEYDGDGLFKIVVHEGGIGGMNPTVILESDGPYSGEVSVGAENPFLFEIISGGDWELTKKT